MAEFLKPEITLILTVQMQPTFGRFSTMYDYPTKGITQASEYPKDACQPWLHYNMRLGNLQIDATLAVGGTGAFGGVVTAPLFKGTFQGPLNGKVETSLLIFLMQLNQERVSPRLCRRTRTRYLH